MSDDQSRLYLAVEGRTDRIVLTKLLNLLDVSIIDAFSKGGKGELLKKLDGYNQNARHVHWLVVLDLDQDAECAPDYARSILPSPNSNMLLRIAVHSIESWLMADRVKMAQYLGIPSENFPLNPDAVKDPKRFLVNLIRRKSRSNPLRQDMLPVDFGERVVGPAYISRLEEFVQKHWRPAVAARRSDSLARCIRALEDLKRQTA